MAAHTSLQQRLPQGFGQQDSDVGNGIRRQLQQRREQVLRELIQSQTLLLDGQLTNTELRVRTTHTDDEEEEEEERVSPDRRRQTPAGRTTSESDRTSPPARPENSPAETNTTTASG